MTPLKKTLIVAGEREDLGDDLPIRARGDGAGNPGAACGFDVQQGLAQLAQRFDGDVGAGQPFFAGGGRARRDALALQAGIYPALGHCGAVGNEPINQGDALAHRKRYPGVLMLLKRLDGLVHVGLGGGWDVGCQRRELEGTMKGRRSHA